MTHDPSASLAARVAPDARAGPREPSAAVALAAKVDYDTRTAVVRFETEKTSIDAITAATTNAGYPSKPLR